MDTGAIAYNHDGTAVLVGSRTESARGAGAICVRSGQWVHPLEPTVDQIDIRDIAHALAMVCRYTGHVSEFWSVAAHSIEVSHRVEAGARRFDNEDRGSYGEGLSQEAIRRLALTALLHDASEAYLVDVPRGLKPLFTGYKANEERLERCIAAKFGLEFPYPGVIKEHDDGILLDEIANFFEPGSGLWNYYGIRCRTDFPRLTPLEPKLGYIRFLRRYEELTR